MVFLVLGSPVARVTLSNYICLYHMCPQGAAWPQVPKWAPQSLGPDIRLRYSPAFEGVPVGHQLLQALLVLEDGRQLLLRTGTGRVQGSGGHRGSRRPGQLEPGAGCRVTSLSLLSGCRTSLSRVISNSARIRASWFWMAQLISKAFLWTESPMGQGSLGPSPPPRNS